MTAQIINLAEVRAELEAEAPDGAAADPYEAKRHHRGTGAGG